MVNGNGTEAARRAGYAGNAKTLSVVAAENLAKPWIKAEVDKRLAAALSGAGITVETVLWELQRATELCMEKEQYGNAIRAMELKGKYLKMFTDRIEHVQNLDEISDDDLDSLMGDLIREGNIDINRFLKGHAKVDGLDDAGPGKETTH